jgi:hypothetical protein
MWGIVTVMDTNDYDTDAEVTGIHHRHEHDYFECVNIFILHSLETVQN